MKPAPVKPLSKPPGGYLKSLIEISTDAVWPRHRKIEVSLPPAPASCLPTHLWSHHDGQAHIPTPGHPGTLPRPPPRPLQDVTRSNPAFQADPLGHGHRSRLAQYAPTKGTDSVTADVEEGIVFVRWRGGIGYGGVDADYRLCRAGMSFSLFLKYGLTGCFGRNIRVRDGRTWIRPLSKLPDTFRRPKADRMGSINHPIAVGNFLSSTGITDVRVIQAAVLHDTVEDTHTTIGE